VALPCTRRVARETLFHIPSCHLWAKGKGKGGKGGKKKKGFILERGEKEKKERGCVCSDAQAKREAGLTKFLEKRPREREEKGGGGKWLFSSISTQ